MLDVRSFHLDVKVLYKDVDLSAAETLTAEWATRECGRAVAKAFVHTQVSRANLPAVQHLCSSRKLQGLSPPHLPHCLPCLLQQPPGVAGSHSPCSKLKTIDEGKQGWQVPRHSQGNVTHGHGSISVGALGRSSPVDNRSDQKSKILSCKCQQIPILHLKVSDRTVRRKLYKQFTL